MSEAARLLSELGATDDEIARALDADDLGIASDLRLLRAATMTARQLAEACDTTLDEVVDIYRLVGITVDDPDQRLFQPGEVELVAMVKSAVGGDGFTSDEGNDILRVTANGFAQIADTAVNEFAAGVEERARRAALDQAGQIRQLIATAELGERFASVTDHLLLHHFREAATRQRRTMRAATTRGLARWAVGFIDLAGYTQRSAEMGPAELSDFVRRFEVTAFDMALELDTRIVKHIGDEVMFVAIEAADGARFARALIDHFDADDVTARGGMACGDVLSRRGDYHGSVVNLASRLADEAVDREILVDEGMRDALGDAVGLEPAGRRKLKGFAEPVRAWSLS